MRLLNDPMWNLMVCSSCLQVLVSSARTPRPFTRSGKASGRQSRAFRILRDGTVTFRIGTFDHSRPLIIDPTLSYSTYLGGGGMDAVTSIAVDGGGNAYVAGWTTSAD